MDYRLRPATTADVDAVSAVFLGCWRESYAPVLPSRLVESMSDERAHAMWTRALTTAGGSTQTIVAVSVPTEEILGVTRFAVETDGTGAVHSLYVSPSAQGLGVGAGLLTAARSALADAGVTAARLWVFRDNVPSIAFYARQGWLPDGTTRIQDEFGEPELRLTHNPS